LALQFCMYIGQSRKHSPCLSYPPPVKLCGLTLCNSGSPIPEEKSQVVAGQNTLWKTQTALTKYRSGKWPLPTVLKPRLCACTPRSLLTVVTELHRSWRWSTTQLDVLFTGSLRSEIGAKFPPPHPFVSKTYFDYLFNCWLSLVNELWGEITNVLNSDASSRKCAGDVSCPNICRQQYLCLQGRVNHLALIMQL